MPAAFTRRWAAMKIYCPTWCGACWRTVPTPRSSTVLSMKSCPWRPWPRTLLSGSGLPGRRRTRPFHCPWRCTANAGAIQWASIWRVRMNGRGSHGEWGHGRRRTGRPGLYWPRPRKTYRPVICMMSATRQWAVVPSGRCDSYPLSRSKRRCRRRMIFIRNGMRHPLPKGLPCWSGQQTCSKRTCPSFWRCWVVKPAARSMMVWRRCVKRRIS